MKKILVAMLSLCLLLPAFAFADCPGEPPIEYQVWNITDGELICTFTNQNPYCPAPPAHVETTVVTTTTTTTTVATTTCPGQPQRSRPCDQSEERIKLDNMRSAALKQLKKFKNRHKEAETGWTYIKAERVLWGWARYILKIYLRNDYTDETIKIYQCLHSDGRLYYTTDYRVDSGKYDDEWILGRSVDGIIDTLRYRIKTAPESDTESECQCQCK